MKLIPILLASLAAIPLGLAVGQRAGRIDLLADVDGPLVTAARQIEADAAALRAEISGYMEAQSRASRHLAERVSALELLHAEPTPEPEPPRTRPTRPAPPPPTQERSVSWSILLRDGSALVGAAATSDDTTELRVGPFELVVVLDDFDGPGATMEPTPTVILSNPYEGSGVVRWQRGTVTVGDLRVDLGPNGAMPPRYAVIQSALTLDHWRLLPEANAPGWLRTRALAELEQGRAYWRGPYRFFREAHVDDNDLGQFHGGREDWLATCAEGRAMRWAEAIGALSRGIWLDWPDETRGYWWDAAAIQYAPPGWQWKAATDGWCAYEQDISRVPLTDMSHGREWYGAVAALAADCKAARYMLMEAVWPEVRRSYSMHPGVSVETNSNRRLYSPLHQILGMLPSPSWGNRREAHAINVVAEAAPYMGATERELYVGAWSTFLDVQVDRFGRADFSFTGDAAGSGLPAPVAMHFQQAQLAGAALNLGTPKALAAAERIARWWGPSPPYFATTSGSYRSATSAPHKGTAYKPYTWWTHPETVDPAAALVTAQGEGFYQSVLDCVPAEARGW